MSKLVIVESPAKAKTISQFLGPDYDVQASFGHVRDLPESASDIPAEYKKQKWAKLGVNVESNFEALYIVPDDKRRHVDNLKRAARGASELLLATDEDREGESISWHILQVLNPSKKVKVSRIVFHEITPEAIDAALKSPRDVDTDLVKAQEARRIVDRLYGYTLSPLLWKKVAPKLSAGRVQSVAVKLCVDRERARAKFVSAEYWDLVATLDSKGQHFDAQLIKVEEDRLATGKSFDAETGKQIDKNRWLKRPDAESLVENARTAEPWTVSLVEAKPGTETPPKPFTTSTLQQEAARKLRFTSKRTMQIAQTLYEGVDLDGERVGLITYMRTDSLNLADRALTEARQVIKSLYGEEYLPKAAVRYKTKSKGAQEAHEAIRPTDLRRRPQDVQRHLTSEQFALYELIWKRTIACQMVAAQVRRTTVQIEVSATEKLTFQATGKEIVFPGFLRAYVEGSDDAEAELDGNERLLPTMKVGQVLYLRKLEAKEHHTSPPARYTEASLIKKLEEEGIGRPSTYVSILSTIQDRGYIFKRGTELVPTWTAFAVTQVLESHFGTFVDTEFTARMERELDEIADGDLESAGYLREFYFGDKQEEGLVHQVDQKTPEIPFPAIPLGKDESSGNDVVVRIGRFGPFLQRGEGGEGNRVSLPGEVAPADFGIEQAIALLNGSGSSAEPVAKDPETGRSVFLKKGRFGDYFEVEQTREEAESGAKPKRVSVPKGEKPQDLSTEDIDLLIRFPREIGKDSNGNPVVVLLGQYGPFVKAGEEIRNIEDWRVAATIDLDSALERLAQPKTFGKRGARTAATPASAIKEFGKLEGAQGPVRVLDGRYGPYVTDGKTNATIPKGTEPTEITADEAMKLILARAGQPKKTKKRVIRRNK